MLSISAFLTDHEIGQPYHLLYSVFIIHLAQYRPTSYSTHCSVPFLQATADDMPVKLRKQIFYIILKLASRYGSAVAQW